MNLLKIANQMARDHFFGSFKKKPHEYPQAYDYKVFKNLPVRKNKKVRPGFIGATV